MSGRLPWTPTWLIACGMIISLLPAPSATAQRDLPPERGGTTYSLGMPPIYKGRAGLESQHYRVDGSDQYAGYLDLGLSRDLGSPVVGIAAWRLEGYLGRRNREFDGGGRALFEIPSFHIGAGVDYNGSDALWDFLLELNLPLKRGGIVGRGTTLAVRWMPGRDGSVGLGINMPLWGRNIGATRPKSDNVRLTRRTPGRTAPAAPDVELEDTLAELAVRARWVSDLVLPFAEPSGADPRAVMGPICDSLKVHLAAVDRDFPDGHTLPAEIDAYHAALDLAFSQALGADRITPGGRVVSDRARHFLLEELLIPYNSLLGQRKKNDSLVGMIAVAQNEFASWVLAESDVPEGRVRPVFYVFQTLCDVMEANRAHLKDRWEDSRFVWLPLQLALTPDQHDTQAELNDVIARSVEQPFTEENRVWYLANEQFQWELARSVRDAEDYHVLWIHDFRGRNGQGKPDAIAFVQTLNYLEALIERVQAFDETGHLPQYFILLDQHYFEINKARFWLRLLSEPLDYTLDMPKGFAEWETRLAATQDRLREAVAGSRLLSLGASQYGESWLKNRIKVHVNITNPADPSFFSWHVAGILPIPDNMMRDHRKIAFYDVCEEDPYKGMALFTGMGVGEHYVGANWEDRAIMIQGPGALATKDAARGLLEAQGYASREIPFPLRERPRPVDYDVRLAAEHAAATPAWMGNRGQVLQLHNETGFHEKPVNVSKAVLYTLMPPGSVLKVPDSLWQSHVYASMLAGSALRGCQVMVIAPTRDSAPSGAAPTLARAHGLLGRLLVFSSEMEEQIDARGGLLKVGLYAPRQGVGDIAGRFEQASANTPAWAGRVWPRNPAADAAVQNARAVLDSLGYRETYLWAEEEILPKIHLKANFFASGGAYRKLMARPEMAPIIRAFVEYLASQSFEIGSGQDAPDARVYPERMTAGWTALVRNMVAEMDAREREEMVFYLTVGSTNMDYRSMVMDGEVNLLLGGWQSLHGLLDFLLLPGLCEWIETPEELDALLPPPSGFVRRLAGMMKLSL